MHINNADESAAENIVRPIDLILTENGRCNYVSPDGKACDQPRVKADRDQARHWITRHLSKELKSIEADKRVMSKARIITTPAKMEVAKLYRTLCPVEGCECKTWFTRQCSLVRHMETCAEQHNIQLSRVEANELARDIMEVVCQPSEFGNGYLGAVWRIHQA